MVEMFGELSPALILVLVLGLVEFSKKFGLAGNAVMALSMALGVLLGLAYQVSTSGIPADFAGWFGYVIFGLIFGLATCGLWDVGKQFRGATLG